MAKVSDGRSFLISKRAAKHKAMTVRIPGDLHEAILQARQRADAVGLLFDVQGAVVKALKDAVDIADVELREYEENKSKKA